MKTKYLYWICISLSLLSCKRNEASGEMEPTWLFWVMLGLIGLGLIFGVVSNSVKSKKGFDSESKTDKEIRGYEETLKKKEQKDKEE